MNYDLKRHETEKMSQVVGILKAHKEEVYNVTKSIANVGPLAVVTKKKF